MDDAGLDFILSDTSAPGVVYTAGRSSVALPDPGYKLETVADPLNPGGTIKVPVATNPNGFLTPQIVTCSGDQTVRMWNVDNGGTIRQFGSTNDFLFAVGVSPDGAIVAAGGQEGILRIYNGNNGQKLRDLKLPVLRW